MELAGKVVLVTGSSRGIGKATAIAFAREGANVIVHCLKNEKLAREVKEKIEEIGVKSAIYKCDVSNTKEANGMIEKIIKDFGDLNVLVNNAGLGSRKGVFEETYRDWQRIIRVNLNGTRNCTIPAIKHMIRSGGGRVVNISSLYLASPAYAAAKAGIVGFTRALAKQLVEKNILVNCVAPGAVDTDMLREGRTTLEMEKYREKMPLRRFARPDEIAQTIVFLTKHDYITGQVFEVTGGRDI